MGPSADVENSSAMLLSRPVAMDGYGGSADEPPVVSDFGAVQGLADFWTFSGTVTDPDDPVEGMVVTFGGVIGGSATVQADGSFSLTEEFVGLQSGIATAQTQDPHGLDSNVAMYYITV